MSKALSANTIAVINAVRTKRSIDDVIQITGMSKPAVTGVLASMKKKDLATVEDGVISLTDAGKEHVNRKRGMNPNKKTAKAFDFLATPAMAALSKKYAEGDKSARKQRVTALMEHLGMSFAGANTYVGNFDKAARAEAAPAK